MAQLRTEVGATSGLRVGKMRRRARVAQSDAAMARLRGEQSALEAEDRALAADLQRMGATLEALEAAAPATPRGVAMSEAQKARFAELREAFEREAGPLMAANEAKRRERATLETRLRQKREQIESQQAELATTRVGGESGLRRSARCRSCADRSSGCSRARARRSARRGRWSRGAARCARSSSRCARSWRRWVVKGSQREAEARGGGARGERAARAVGAAGEQSAGEPAARVRGAAARALPRRARAAGGPVRADAGEVGLRGARERRYNVAASAALGKHLDAVVVGRREVAIECVQWALRGAGE